MERQIISSRQNPTVKLVCGLADKKKRQQSGLFRFDGIKLLCEAIDSEIEIRYVFCRAPVSQRTEQILGDALRHGRISEQSIIEVSESVFDKLSEEKSPEGVLCVAHLAEHIHMHSDIHTDRLPEGKLLIAESLRDPGNLGTVMRSCYALGIDTLVLTDDCADIYNPRTVRAAMGAAFKMKTLTLENERLPEFIHRLRESGRRVYAAALAEDSMDIGDIGLLRGDCFVIGNEGHGLRDKTIEACDACVIIPMREDAESLNAAAAAVICVWETVRADGKKRIKNKE